MMLRLLLLLCWKCELHTMCGGDGRGGDDGGGGGDGDGDGGVLT